VETQNAKGGLVAKLIYRAAAGEANRVDVALETTGGRPIAYLLKSNPAVSAPVGCEPTPRTGELRCPIPDGTRPTGPLLELGDVNDRVVLTAPLDEGATIMGGTGNDRLLGGGLLDGGHGNDMLGVNGRSASRIEGGPGKDQISGGPRSDMIQPGPGEDSVGSGAGADRVQADDRSYDSVSCGAGRDRVVLDGLDIPQRSCERIRRTAPPRAIPTSISDDGQESWVTIVCPFDSPRSCVSVVTVAEPSGRRVDRSRVHIARGRRATGHVVFYPHGQEILEQRRARVSVTTRGRGGRGLIYSTVLPLNVLRE
jgi:hypothetical protein